MIRIEEIEEDSIIFYDIETTGVYAPYCELKMIGYQLGLNSEPRLVDPNDKKSMATFRKLVGSPDVMKVGYNNINFDDIVLWRYGFFVHPRYRHDLYLAMKTIHPTFPSYSLKFINWWIDANQTPEGANHFWEHDLHKWMRQHYVEHMYRAPIEMLGEYCLHDVRETVNVFCAVWEKVQNSQHWKPYTTLELAMGEPLHEMILLGRELIDTEDIKKRITQLEIDKVKWNDLIVELSDGRIKNGASSKQLGKFFTEVEMVSLGLTDKGDIAVRKLDLLALINLEDEQNLPKLVDIEREGKKRGAGTTYFDTESREGRFDPSKVSRKRKSHIAKCAYVIRDTAKVIGYLRSYLNAGNYERRWQRRISTNGERQDRGFHPINTPIGYETGRDRDKYNTVQGTNSKDSNLVLLPKSYGLSAAKTRRFRSSSKFSYKKKNGEEVRFGINWQNQNKRSKVVQLVPRGWLAFWLDSTQIENVVHIWASDDLVRRRAYESDENWNEYVWLSNMILGTNLDREKLDQKMSTVNPSWSVYKQYKTIKLALNFGMGPDKFAKTVGLNIKDAIKEFDKVHKACPAIKKLQNIVKATIRDDKCIEDPFGHIYSGEEPYKIVAYLVQGCGTGSVPKAMTIANYKTLHECDTGEHLYDPYVRHPYTGKYSHGVLCGTTHDECAGRISLGLSTERIVDLVRNLLYNMEGRFSKLFDGIPLRAKLAVSITNAAEQEELDHRKGDFEKRLVAYITKGRERYEKG